MAELEVTAGQETKDAIQAVVLSDNITDVSNEPDISHEHHEALLRDLAEDTSEDTDDGIIWGNNYPDAAYLATISDKDENDSSSTGMEESDPRLEAEAAVLSTYTRLRNGEIRVLRLMPGKVGDDIRCDLYTTTLDSKPHYEAISYAWGISYNLVPIVLNGKRCLRRHNLLACLENLRDEVKCRMLWVDALCINQSDMEERNAQIRVMPQIYRFASRTLIWLGNDGLYSVPQLAGTSSPTLRAHTPTKPSFSESLQFLEQFAIDRHVHLQYDKPTATLLYGLQLVCEFDWWSRMWVVQETLLSASAYIILGKYTLSWTVMCQAASSLLNHVTTCCRQLQSRLDNRKYEKRIKQHVHDCVQIIQSFQRIPSNNNNDLLAHLWTFRNRLASANHDKVYGILGLLNRQDSLLEPDYGEHFAALCRSVIVKDIKLSNNLNAFRGTRESDSPDITSWSIDWSCLDYWSKDRLRVLSGMYKQIYYTSLDHTPRVAEYDIRVSGWWALRVAGRVLDRVVHVTCRLEFDNNTREHDRWEHVLGVLRALIFLRNKASNASYVTGGSYFNAFWRTLLADCIIPHTENHGLEHTLQDSEAHQHQPRVRRATFADFFAFMLWFLTVNRYTFSSRMNKRPLIVDGLLMTEPVEVTSVDELLSHQYAAEQIRTSEAVQRISASVARATSGRCMFVTEQGYIGLGPHSLKSGDSIAVLLGGSTPFALERGDIEGCEEEHWKLHGDCYVHGWMDGELVQNENTQDWGNVVLV